MYSKQCTQYTVVTLLPALRHVCHSVMLAGCWAVFLVFYL